MTRKRPRIPHDRVAAFHEAGHAVAAYNSRFHSLMGDISVGDYASGKTFVTLSKRKLADGAKPAVPSVTNDPEVAADLAIVLCAGLAAERLAARHVRGLIPNPESSELDHSNAVRSLSGASLPTCLDAYEAAAERLLLAEWNAVDLLARWLHSSTTISAVDVIDFLKRH